MRVRAGVARVGLTSALVGCTIASAQSCKDPTSVEIEVRTTLKPSEVRATRFFVGGDPFTVESDVSNGYLSAETRAVDGTGLVGTLVSVPSNGESGTLSIVVIAAFLSEPSSCTPQNGYAGCIVARRQLAYRENERLRVPILLDPSCVGVPCDAISTCASGTCFSSSVDCDDDGSCRGPENGGRQRPPDRPIDGGGDRDGASDAARDVAIDARPDVADASGSDAPSEGGGTPGVIACPPGSPCPLSTHICCRQSGMAMCVTNNQACVTPTLNIRCDGPEDCAGSRCCITATGTNCLITCAGDDQLCNTNADCSASKPSCTDFYASAYRSCK